MFKISPLATLLVCAALFLTIACAQETKTEASIYPDNEIPVNTDSEEALQAFVSGLEALDLGNDEEARPFFDKALELDPNFVSAQMYRAFSSSSLKEWGENRTKLLSMRDKANEAEAIMMDRVEAGMEDDELKELELSKKLAEKYPKSARAQDELAGSYRNLDKTEEARAHFIKAIELNPDFILSISNLGDSYLFDSPRDFKKAEEYMAMVVEKRPGSSRAHISLGDCYRAQKDLEKALASYEKAAELDPKDEVAFSKAGHANSFLGNMDAARKNFQDARAVSEFGTNSYDFEALTYLYEDDAYEKALAFLEGASKSVADMNIPESNKTATIQNCNFNCAMIAMHYGESEQLKQIVENMKPLSVKLGQDIGSNAAVKNQQANMHYWDAMASAVDGNYEDAAAKAELIKTALESINDPQKLRPYHRVHGYVNYKLGNYDKALEHMAELSIDNVYDKYWMAKANQMAGNTDKAMELYNEIADYNFNFVGYALIRNEVKGIVAKGTVS